MKGPPVAKFECLKCKYSDYRMSAREVGELVPNECPKCGKDLKVVAKEPPKWLAEPLALVGKHFEISDFIALKDRIELEVSTRDSKRSFRSLLDSAKRRGYLPVMRGREDELRLMVAKLPKIEKSNVMINILLLVATLGTTFWAGYFWLSEGSIIYGFLFSGSIMLILGAHELGHKIAAWRHGVAATLPYFIPLPMFLGTLGAFIKIKSPIPTKEALVEMGMSGPIFGFLVAIPITVIGLTLPRPIAPISLPFTPLLFGLFAFLIPGAPGFHPLAFAGLVGMLVTMLNLIPAGQLDGGHVARGLMGRERHYGLTRTLGFSLLLFGLFFPQLLFLGIFGFFILFLFRGYHVGALDDVSKLSKRQKSLAAATFIVFLLCLPIPLG